RRPVPRSPQRGTASPARASLLAGWKSGRSTLRVGQRPTHRTGGACAHPRVAGAGPRHPGATHGRSGGGRGGKAARSLPQWRGRCGGGRALIVYSPQTHTTRTLRSSLVAALVLGLFGAGGCYRDAIYVSGVEAE